MKSAALVFALLVSLVATAQVTPAPGSVQGIVMRAGTTDPIVRARVILNTLSAPANAPPRVTTTDDGGRFVLGDLPPGSYQLLVTHEGYVRAEFGQRGPGAAGATINLSLGQNLRDVAVAMTPTGSITGRIFNRLGEPLPNVAVRALRYVYDTGQPVLTAMQMVRTNDLGEYRLYYLEPGPYLVSALPPLGVRTLPGDAGSQMRMGSVEVLPGDRESNASNAVPTGIFTTTRQLARMGFLSTADTGETYAPTFFPGTAEPSAAVAVRVEPGASAAAIDFALMAVRAVMIRGQVTTGTGQPQRGVAVALLSPGDGSDGIPVDHYGSVSDTGAFEFKGVAPGLYDIVASVGLLPPGFPAFPAGEVGGARIDTARKQLPAAAVNARLVGRASIRVGDVDLDRVTVTLHSGFTVNGRITVEGQTPAVSESMTSGILVQLQSDPPDVVPDSNPRQRVQTGSIPATAGQGGRFVASGVFPGTYRIAMFNAVRLPGNAYVKSAQFGNRDALNPRLRIDDSPQGILEIVIGTNPGNLDISVLNDTQRPAIGVTVVLVPSATFAQHYDLYRTAISDASGRARFSNVAAGDYTAYALEDVRPGAWWDPEFIRTYEGRGKTVRISDGGAHTLELSLNPVEAVPR